MATIVTTHGPLEIESVVSDGKTHVNIYSKARTELGRHLTNFSPFGINHPDYGQFASLEAFYYWLGTGKQWDLLRTMTGYAAKQMGQQCPRVDHPEFQKEFLEGIRLRFEQHPTLWEAFLANPLPLTHYYYFGGVENAKLVDAKRSQWILEYYGKLQKSRSLRRVNGA